MIQASYFWIQHVLFLPPVTFLFGKTDDSNPDGPVFACQLDGCDIGNHRPSII